MASYNRDRAMATPPYLLTAYGIAQRHGYSGTEEEWLASLVGAPGEAVDLRFNAETKYIQYRHESDAEWTDLVSMDDLMTEDEAAVLAAMEEIKAAVETAVETAGGHSEDAEAWAVGERGGVDVEETDETYHNNAKYYAGEAAGSASAAAASVTSAANQSHNASVFASNAASSASSAQNSASSASSSASSASGLALSAQNSATAAAESAVSAGESASSAAAALSDAESIMTKAQTAANSAFSDAERAHNWEQEAERQAALAAGAAQGAASEVAQTLEQYADRAEAAAQTATTQAGAASDSATAAAASAAAAQEAARTLTIDTTLTQEGQAAEAKKTGDEIADLKSAITDIDDIIYSDVDVTPASDELFNNGYVVGADNANLGHTIYSTSRKYTDYIDISGSSAITLDVSMTPGNTQIGLAFYNAQKTAISGYVYPAAEPETHETKTVTVPTTAKYVRITIYTEYLESFFLTKKINIRNDIDDIKDDISGLTTQVDNTISIDRYNNRLKPYIVETKARYLWALNHEPDIFKNSDPRYTEDGSTNNAYFKISGNQGDDYVTVISGGNASPSDIADYSDKWSGVISYDGINYEPCIAWYRDASTLGVYPSLKNDISDGELGAMWSDDLHLTRRGYIGFAQAVFNADPKYCEKKSYIAKWIAGDDVPFTSFGGTMYASTGNAFNYADGGFIFANQFMTYSKRNTAGSATTDKRGISWTVATAGKKGYVEIMVGGMGTNDPVIPTGNEIHIDVYGDNVLLDNYVKTTNILEDVCIDFANANNVKIEIYLTQQAASSANGSGFRLSSIHFWEHERVNADTLFPRGAVVGQMFDSWGVYHDGASAKEFSRLINVKTGVTVPYNNHSLGSQTSAWGKAWFYENLQQYHPVIGIVDFGINDSNSMAETVPATVLGPDGTAYDNKIDINEYAVNMQTIADEAKSNNIQIIMTSMPLTKGGDWYYALTDNVG